MSYSHLLVLKLNHNKPSSLRDLRKFMTNRIIPPVLLWIIFERGLHRLGGRQSVSEIIVIYGALGLISMSLIGALVKRAINKDKLVLKPDLRSEKEGNKNPPISNDGQYYRKGLSSYFEEKEKGHSFEDRPGDDDKD